MGGVVGVRTKARITETEDLHFPQWFAGDTGVIDFYLYAEKCGPMAVVILDKNRKIVWIPIRHLETIGEVK